MRLSPNIVFRQITGFLFLCLMVVSMCVWPAAGLAEDKPALTAQEAQDVWGIKIVSLRPTMDGHMIDLRYQVLDAEKATPVLNRDVKAFLTNQATNKTISVPVTKAGPLRQTTLKPEKGRVYFVLFQNRAEGNLAPGDLALLTIGDLKIKDIKVVSEMAPMDLTPTVPKLDKEKWDFIKDKQEELNAEFQVCIEHCGHSLECVGKCEKAFEARLEREYQQKKNQ